jgi:hypothetical protein
MMLNAKCLAFIFCMLAINQVTQAQLGFSHEIGVVAGPVQFRSDFGVRNDSETNFGNSGLGIGIVHYINFAYRADCNCYTTDKYFNDHFKLRNEISWNRTNLEHLGTFVESSRQTEEADKLRGHTAIANNFDIGTQLEFYPLSIRSFQSYGYKIAPYISLGVHLTAFNPNVKTTFDNGFNNVGDTSDPDNFYTFWAAGSVDPASGTAFSMVSSVGFRYKVGRLSDVVFDLRWQYFFNDWVDGLNHNLPSNKNDDWLVWLNIGYIYYLN